MKYYVICVILLFLLSTIHPITGSVLQNKPEKLIEQSKNITIYVDDDNNQGPWDGSYEYPYQHIYDSILHASDSDIIFVFNGLYKESIVINKSIHLQGEQQNNTIIDAMNNGSVITIVNNDTCIKEFTIRNSGGYQGNAGIHLIANNTTITECTIFSTRAGIFVQHGNGTVINNCQFHTNGYGIILRTSTFVFIEQCNFYHNGIGVYSYETENITIAHSYTDTNGIGFLCEHSSYILISDSAARDNNDNEGGIFFSSCHDISIINCYITHNGFGVNLINSSYCFIEKCNFSFNTHFACKLQESRSDIFLTNCIFIKNFRYAVYAEDSMFSISQSNLIQNENYGLFSKSSVIDARFNWWGSKQGPAHTGLTSADRGSWKPKEIIYFPWRFTLNPDGSPNWNLETKFPKPLYSSPLSEKINFTDKDSDNDIIPDWWELKWGYNPEIWDDHQFIDADEDSLNNIEECYMDRFGSNPFKQDVFLEFDWTESYFRNTSNKPPDQYIKQMITAFERHNITLHVDTGELGGGEQIPASSIVTYADIITLYWDYFLHNDLNNPRQHIFHYGIICDYSEGPGFAVIGWSHLNSFIIGAQFLAEKYPNYKRDRLVMTSAMHEVGHTFGLIVTKFNGIDNHLAMKPTYKEFWIYCRYISMLNYLYTFSLMDFSDGSHGKGDFNDWGNLDFSFFKNTNFRYPL